VITLRELVDDDWQDWRELRLRALAEDPDAFGSTLSDWSGPLDTEARWRGRLHDVAHNVLAELDGEPVGMVSATEPSGGIAELISMWVAPSARGHGAGDALMQDVARWAHGQQATMLLLDVREANDAAIGLYVRHGFTDVGPTPAEPGAPPERRMTRPLP
jgi:ribosomal protein S18 acetylase RimI-like enzyme